MLGGRDLPGRAEVAVPREGLEVAGRAGPDARLGPIRPVPPARADRDRRVERAPRIRGRSPDDDGPDGGPSSAGPVARRRARRAPDAPARGRDRKAPGVRARGRRFELALHARVPRCPGGIGPRVRTIPDPRAYHLASALVTSRSGRLRCVTPAAGLDPCRPDRVRAPFSIGRAANNRRIPGTPRSSCTPRSANLSPLPETTSRTVEDTRTSPGRARLANRAATCTATPRSLPSSSSHSPVWTPVRTSRRRSAISSWNTHANATAWLAMPN